MSLINDALKRARQTQQKNPPPPAGAPLRPVEATRTPGSARGAWLPVLLAAVLVICGGALILFAFSLRSPKDKVENPRPVSTTPAAAKPKPIPTAATTPAPMNPTAAPKPVPAPAPAVVSQPAVSLPPPVVVVPPPAAPAVVATATATESNASAVAAPPAPPPIPKLQGIFFHPARPSAIVNGKTVSIGGKVGDFRVVAITQQSVTLVHAGQTNILKLEE
ncbi:MAG: hypothetical protein EXS35_06040 [Pedosphaera sp.]|nr:hypothetical protein [Pedosphaera sp.]